MTEVQVKGFACLTKKGEEGLLIYKPKIIKTGIKSHQTFMFLANKYDHIDRHVSGILAQM